MVMVGAWFVGNLWINGRVLMDGREPDEAAWIFSTYYYHLAFQKGELTSPDWRHYDCVDHPPVAKFVFGAALAPGDHVVKTLDYKEWWIRHQLDSDGYAQFAARLREGIPLKVLFRGRLVSTASFAISAWLMFVIARRAFSSAVAWWALVFFSIFPQVLKYAALGMAEGLHLLLLLLSVWVQLAWVERVIAGRPVGLTTAGLAAVLALLFNTKITGLAALPLSVFALAASCWTARRAGSEACGVGIGRTRLMLRSCGASAALLVAFALLAVAMNPSLYQGPIGFIAAMFRHRWHQVELQQAWAYALSNPTPAIMLASFTRGLFFTNDFAYQLAGVPMMLFLFLLGCVKLPTYARRAPLPTVVLALNGLAWIAITAYTYRLDWQRYLLPANPFVLLIAAVGMEELVARLRNVASTWARRVAMAGALAGAVVLIGVMAHRWTTQRYMAEHPEWVEEMRSRAFELQVRIMSDEPL